MENISISTAKYIRMSPSKIQLVANLVRGKDYQNVEKILKSSKKIASKKVWQTIDAAAADATYFHKINKNNLFVKEIFVNKGPILKRGRPRAQGRIFKILKRTSHLTVKLSLH